MADWVKALLDDWIQAANLTVGKLFRRVNKNGSHWGDGLTEKAVWRVVREYARKAGSRGLRHTIFAGRVPGSAILRVANWSRFSFFSGTDLVQATERYSAAHSELLPPCMTRSELGGIVSWPDLWEGLPTIRPKLPRYCHSMAMGSPPIAGAKGCSHQQSWPPCCATSAGAEIRAANRWSSRSIPARLASRNLGLHPSSLCHYAAMRTAVCR
jgi:hypothetical protein